MRVSKKFLLFAATLFIVVGCNPVIKNPVKYISITNQEPNDASWIFNNWDSTIRVCDIDGNPLRCKKIFEPPKGASNFRFSTFKDKSASTFWFYGNYTLKEKKFFAVWMCQKEGCYLPAIITKNFQWYEIKMLQARQPERVLLYRHQWDGQVLAHCYLDRNNSSTPKVKCDL